MTRLPQFRTLAKAGCGWQILRPIADLRRDEYITVMCRKPTMSELSFVRAVIAECWAWELTEPGWQPRLGLR